MRMRRRERDGCGTFRFFEVSSRGATAHHTPPRQCREEGRKYSFRRRDTVDAWTRRIANGENFFFEKTESTFAMAGKTPRDSRARGHAGSAYRGGAHAIQVGRVYSARRRGGMHVEAPMATTAVRQDGLRASCRRNSLTWPQLRQDRNAYVASCRRETLLLGRKAWQDRNAGALAPRDRGWTRTRAAAAEGGHLEVLARRDENGKVRGTQA